MDAVLPVMQSILPRVAVAFVLGSLCMATLADNAVEHARQRGTLVVGMDYVTPLYVAGAKFRTPENIDPALAESVARQIKVRLHSVAATKKDYAKALGARRLDIVLASLLTGELLDKSLVAVPTGYAASAMAIMRTDTTIKTWEQLKGRTVCVAKDGRYVGLAANKYGAVEKIYRAPADALLALRIGECDAAVHDNVLLEQILKLPEWKKFSARLPVGPVSSLVFAVPANDTQTISLLSKMTRDWAANGHLRQITEKMARNIAFEVYLDQNVPDCH